jgi:acetate---CoA ligase (ADP-forming)
LAEIGVPCYTSLRGPALALAALADRAAAVEALARQAVARPDHAAQATALRYLDAAADTLCEYEAGAVLAAYGIATLPGILAKDAGAAADAASSIGYPVALKIQSPDIPHKSDAGGVALGLCDAASVRAACEAMLACIAAALPAARLHGIFVQKMAPRGLEMIAGTVDDDDFGPLLTVGFGGIHVEVLGDIATVPLPIDAPAADALLDRLRGARLLGSLRGAPARDRTAFAALLVRLATLQADFAGRIATIDLNPVFLHDDGDGISVADALIVQHSTAKRGTP